MSTLNCDRHSSLTLSSNTGLNSQSREGYGLGVDWLTLLLAIPNTVNFVDVLDSIAHGLLDTIIWKEDSRPIKRGRWFEYSARSVCGIQFCWNILDSGIECLISLPSKSLTVGQLEVARTFSYVRRFVSRVSRFDAFIDDYSKELGAMRELMAKARDDGNAVGFQSLDWRHHSKRKGEIETTLYLGNRESSHYYRIYDKGERVRMEVELKDHKAFQAFEMWLDTFSHGMSETFENGDMVLTLSTIVLSHIDFLDKKDKNLGRNERLDWWQSFLDKFNVSRVRFNRELPIPTLERTKEWIERQVETSLSMLKTAMGSFQYTEWMGKIMDEGAKRMGGVHRSLIQNYKQVTEYLRRCNRYAEAVT